ncbi:permease-like cell division protein FtsX [Paenibacillus aquistagni]|uniref:Cell division protein FtsX n=1 Tax=Paenibacillus aquistagni TaxID=1852522 RepID=A0A1X7KXY2_9BACL|nr:permease-like cell division protein FtsX [Paenibacillus aquistagni]NMM54285.1 ABC transporter permease [Paenibacillus aquistagni]SMG46441.1 cell division protein FtsX [Paenibacillus aquistagni]
MTANTMTRHIREGSKSIYRNGWMSIASISSIVISLFILGVFILLSFNLNVMTSELDSKVQIRVYLQLEVTQDEVALLRTDIGNMAEVSKVEYVTKQQGMDLLEESLGEDGKDILSGYTDETNPLPDSFTVEVKDPQTVGMVAKKIQALNETNAAQPIWKVKYGQGSVEKLFQMTKMIRNFGLILVAGLAITAMFLISNTIKITIMARQREIGIMKLVGATNSFIRWPFFVEGFLIGLIGAVVTIAILFLGYDQLLSYAATNLSFIQLIPFEEVWLMVGSVLLALGILIGVWGSTISIRKFLKV